MKPLVVLLVLAACDTSPPSQATADCRERARIAYYQTHARPGPAEFSLGLLTLWYGGQFLGRAIDDATDPPVPDAVLRQCGAVG